MKTTNVDDLFERQLAASEHFRKVFTDLGNVKTRTVDFDGFHYMLQYNPGRIGSATADTKKKVNTDNCFLCEAHRFPKQIALEYDQQYNILVNPFPIFKKHFTIVDKCHVPQEIVGEEAKIIQMAESMPGLTVFYNSRNSGASAPFHRHFQACETKELPVFYQWDSMTQNYCVMRDDNPSDEGSRLVFDGTRYMYLINTQSQEHAVQTLTEHLTKIQKQCNSESPEANVGVAVDNGHYRIVIFPRAKHRPEEYFATGDNHFTISPGFADMAGLIPCAVENDFEKLNKDNIKSIFTQVTLKPKTKLTN